MNRVLQEKEDMREESAQANGTANAKLLRQNRCSRMF